MWGSGGVHRKEHPDYTEQRVPIVRFARKIGFRVRLMICERLDTAPRDFLSRSGIERLLAVAGHETKGGKPRTFRSTVVLVHDCSRFSAPELDVAALILHLHRLQVRVFEVSTGRELTGDVAPMQRALDRADTRDRESIRHRLAGAKWRAGKRRSGRRCGPKPFGQWPGEEEVLKEILRLRRKPARGHRRSYASIADELNKRSLPSRSGRPWGAKAIQVIVRRTRPGLAE